MKVVWSPLALQKLGDAAEFIALDNPSAAENWVNEVFDKAERSIGLFGLVGFQAFVIFAPILSGLRHCVSMSS